GTPLDRSTTLIDFGGYYYFRKPAFQLLYSVGHAVAGSSETYAYLGLYWTWGGEAGRDAADDRAAAVGWSQIPLNGTRRAR
ncbi:MAG: hypothetical protein KGL34_03700, partial [Gammaproteobacteria bacterium]|nr:hypothetical protein [Gammaproteobacteria bacterium]